MIVNRDQMNAHSVKIEFDGGKAKVSFAGSVSMITFGSEQYQWHPDEKGGHADPDGPAAQSTIKAAPGTVYNIPKASITVLRGNVPLVR